MTSVSVTLPVSALLCRVRAAEGWVHLPLPLDRLVRLRVHQRPSPPGVVGPADMPQVGAAAAAWMARHPAPGGLHVRIRSLPDVPPPLVAPTAALAAVVGAAGLAGSPVHPEHIAAVPAVRPLVSLLIPGLCTAVYTDGQLRLDPPRTPPPLYALLVPVAPAGRTPLRGPEADEVLTLCRQGLRFQDPGRLGRAATLAARAVAPELFTDGTSSWAEARGAVGVAADPEVFPAAALLFPQEPPSDVASLPRPVVARVRITGGGLVEGPPVHGA